MYDYIWNIVKKLFRVREEDEEMLDFMFHPEF